MSESEQRLIGRESETSALIAMLRRAVGGCGSLSVVTGAAGVGKTRLATHAAAAAADLDLSLWIATPDVPDEEAAPVVRWRGSLSHSARLVAAEDPARRLCAQLEAIAQAGGAIAPGYDVHLRQGSGHIALTAAVDDVLDRLEHLVCTRPALVVIDDVDRIPGHRALLERLRRITSSLPIAAIVVDGDAWTSRVSPVRPGQPGEDLYVRLEGLTPTEVAGHLADHLGAPVDDRLLRKVIECTRGDAYLVGEAATFLAGSRAAGRRSQLFARFPATPEQLVHVKTRRLSTGCRDLLTMAAAIGPVFDYALLAAVVGKARDELVAHLDEASRAGVIEDHVDRGSYRFTHELLRTVLLDEVSATRRLAMHSEIADALEQRSAAPGGGHAVALLHHLETAAVLDPSYARRALPYLHAAAERARAQSDWLRAARLYERVVDLIDRAPVDDVCERSEALYELGKCWVAAGEVRLAWRALMNAAIDRRQLGEQVAEAEVVAFALENIDVAARRRRALARDVLQRLPVEDETVELRARLLMQISAHGDDRQALDALREVQDLVERFSLVAVRDRLMEREFEQMVARGNLEGARALLARRLASDNSDEMARANDLFLKAKMVALSGGLTESWILSGNALAYADHWRVQTPALNTRRLRMSLALTRGDYGAFDLLELEVPERPVFQQLRARRLEDSGDYEGALACLPSQNALGASHPRLRWDLDASRARLLAKAGHLAEARAYLAVWAEQRDDELSHPLDRQGAIALAGEAIAILGAPDLVRDALAESRRCESVRFNAMYSIGVDRVRGLLARSLGERDLARYYFDRAVAWARREDAPIELGLALFGLASVATDTAERREDLAEAQDVFARHGAHALVAEVQRDGGAGDVRYGSLPVTPRESDILRLVSEGMTNRQIGLTLGISYHTAARHVSNVLRKIGAGNRAEAAVFAARHGILDREHLQTA